MFPHVFPKDWAMTSSPSIHEGKTNNSDSPYVTKFLDKM